MGRRRKRAVKIVRRVLPELYLCPRCGKNTVKSTINKKRERAVVVCSSCSLNTSFPSTPGMGEVDAYCRFIDIFYEGDMTEETVVG
jgi:transcription elongation factor Elf1